MATWRPVTDSSDARDLRVDADTETRERLSREALAAPDFTQLRGPGNRITRRLSGRNN